MQAQLAKILVLIDYSYFQYYTIFSAFNKWSKNSKSEAEIMVKSADETDQSNLPDLLVSDSFKRELKRAFIKRCEMVNVILSRNFENDLDIADDIEIIAVQDDSLNRSFRKELFPEYKAQRALTKKAYDVKAIKKYIENILLPDLEKSGNFNYKILKVTGAEGDDVIATVLKHCAKDYYLKILIASDHDFLQLPDVKQFDLMGREVKAVLKTKKEEIELDSKMVLLTKIIQGDLADNIPAIAEKIGKVKAYKLANNAEQLRTLLIENQDAAKQFALNKKIIDFNEIPESLTQEIITKAKSVFAAPGKHVSEEDARDVFESTLMAL